MEFQKRLEFRGTWREYQARVLSNAQRYLSDGKVHICAAPGSGKTLLGIELISRIGKPALILAPTIVIRDQWKTRIEEWFLEDPTEASLLVSFDLRKPKQITVSTYQALYSAMTGYKGSRFEGYETEGDDPDGRYTEEYDFTGFDLVKSVKAAGLSVLCLDECHHLKNEWWRALESFCAVMKAQEIISLMATPPYDSSYAEWSRYIAMCGEIDEEITVPELVKEGSLCPHQDYIYFNFPTEQEEESVLKYRARVDETIFRLLADDEFLSAVSRHVVFTGDKSVEEMLEDPGRLSAILIYLKSRHADIPEHLLRMLGVHALPEMTAGWMERLLQDLLFESPDEYACSEEYRKGLERELRKDGLIFRNRVALTSSPSVEKALTNSKGKIRSLTEIARYEYGSLGQGLRMVVLTDYIRREYEKLLGTFGTDVTALGVIPFFEELRRTFEKELPTFEQPKLAILTGTLVVIPADAKEDMIAASDRIGSGLGDKLRFFMAGQLPRSAYLGVDVQGDRGFLTAAVTELFAAGKIHIIVGTKSLLGEGWDSPCINSLILASFVGSYVLSNQMRGRAIRVVRNDPGKTSNIWHLVCVEPEGQKEQNEPGGTDFPISDDWQLLKRRAEHFMGLNYSEDTIESGIDRFTCIRLPFTEENIGRTNADMVFLSGKRSELRERWQRSLDRSKRMEHVKETAVPNRSVPKAVFQDSLRKVLTRTLLAAGLPVATGFWFADALFGPAVIAGTMFAAGAAVSLPKLIKQISPYARLRGIGNAVLKAMQKCGALGSDGCSVAVTDSSGSSHTVYLSGGTSFEKELFSKSISEFFAPVDNQRYLLVSKKNRMNGYGFFCVPEYFASNKKNAGTFAECIRDCLGPYELVYTRTEAGRKLLLEGRIFAFANIQELCTRKSRMRSPLE